MGSSELANVVALVFPGVGSLSKDVMKLRSMAECSTFYADASKQLASRGVALDQVWDRVARSSGPLDVSAADEIVLQLLVQVLHYQE